MPMQEGTGGEVTPKFRYHMLREVYEQPGAVRQTIERHLDQQGNIKLDRHFLLGTPLARVVIVASGASRHAGLAGKVMIEDLAGIPVEVSHASEYCYRKPLGGAETLAVFITQSGETADTIAALRTAHEAGLRTLAISNVENSTIVREADSVFLSHAGVEVAIPATKSFTAQLTALLLLALSLAEQCGRMAHDQVQAHLAHLKRVPEMMQQWLPRFDREAEAAAKNFHKDNSFLMIGRAVHHPMAMEAALKLKEICYVHAEGYASGELRHGPTALVDESTPVIVIATVDENDPDSTLRYEKSITLVEELRQRKARILLVADEGDRWAEGFAPNLMSVPRSSELLLPLLEILPLQLFAYHVALLNGFDVDRPRNLVKSVQED